MSKQPLTYEITDCTEFDKEPGPAIPLAILHDEVAYYINQLEMAQKANQQRIEEIREARRKRQEFSDDWGLEGNL